jgi:hypothetical protein
MTTNQKRIFSVVPLFIFVLNELIRAYVRPVYGQKQYGLISDVLGWLPNLLAAWGVMTLGASLLLLFQELSKTHFSRRAIILFVVLINFVALTGLIIHEVTQKGTGLYYDVQDIYATIIGVVTGNFFLWISLRTAAPPRNAAQQL